MVSRPDYYYDVKNNCWYIFIINYPLTEGMNFFMNGFPVWIKILNNSCGYPVKSYMQ